MKEKMNVLNFVKYNVLILVYLALTGMTNDTVCLKEVKQVFDNMNESVVQNKTCYLKYSIITYLNSTVNNEKVNKGTFEMMTSKLQSRIYSKEMIILKDQKNMFSILPQRKVIYWADAVVQKKGENLYDQLSALQDSIFKNVKKIECKEVKDKPYDKIISIELNEKMSAFLEIKSATYFINNATKMLKNVVVNYMPGHQYQKLEYDFETVDLDYTKADMTIPVQKLIFEQGTKTQKEYQGFQVKDNRKK